MAISWNPQYDDYLRDESRQMGRADSISFPKSIVEIVDTISAGSGPVTIQGGRTGIVAGAVPLGGHILNLSRMNTIGHVSEEGGEYRINVQPGVLLSDLNDVISRRNLMFPPYPTETSASIGGMVACNASGALTFRYGPTRDWIRSIRMVLPDGDLIRIGRGENRAQGRSFSITTEGGRVISGSIPRYTMPPVKSAAGYYAADDMDILDLFIGMEGTLGVISEIELRLIPTPDAVNGLTIFLPSEEAALKSVRVLRGETGEAPARPAAIEFFNSDALNLLRDMKSRYSAFEKIPVLKPEFNTAIYTEFHGGSDEELEESVLGVIESLACFGVSDENTWFATTEKELTSLKAFRHAVPEAVNLLIDERKRVCPELTKLGTDMSVPDEHLEAAMAMYNGEVKELGLESVIFGHIGNNHVHVNILPETLEEYERGKSLYASWAKRVVEMGGSVSAEHGIGKLKAPFLELMYGREAVAEMRALKALFDPEMRLNPGNLFS